MKVLLTGATGFLGRYVLNQLQQAHIPVIPVGRVCPPGYSGDYLIADLLRLDEIAAMVSQAQATHLLHLAWFAEHGKYWDSVLNLRWTEATVRLVEAFSAAGGQRVVIAGTCAEYDWSYGYCREEITPL